MSRVYYLLWEETLGAAGFRYMCLEEESELGTDGCLM